MNNPSRAAVDARKARFKPGCRVELVNMDDPHTNLKPGDRGNVQMVDSIGTVHIQWDNGSTLGAAYGVDAIRLLAPPVGKAVTEQILAIRGTGTTNMFDANAVLRIALDSGFLELVDFIITDSKGYSNFILTGGRDGGDE